MGIMVGGGRDTIVRDNNFIHCDIALHIDGRGMTGERPNCLHEDAAGLRAAMAAPAWAKYALRDQDLDANVTSPATCAPVNASVSGNCFADNLQNWEVWCNKGVLANKVGAGACINDAQWLGHEGGNFNGSCTADRR